MTTVEQRLTRLEAVYEHLATRADIADLRAEMKADIGNLRAEMKAVNGDLRAEMHRINATLIRWLVSLMAGSLVIGLGAITAIFRFLG